jgi:simple sugar transport system permease protein
MMDIVLNWLVNSPDFAVPYALAALGLILTERSGVLSLGAEGFMLVGALVGVGAQLAFGAAGISLFLAMLAAAVVSLLFALMVIVLRVNQVIAGLAIVFFCQGLTSLGGTLLGWTNQALTGTGVLPLGVLADIPVLGRLLFNQNVVVYLTIPIFIVVALFINRSTTGLRLRAVGENPQAADAAGLAVGWYRLGAIVAGAALVGLAGAYLSVYSTKLWVAGMTGGRGWIAVGLVIFARWSPWRALAGAFLFGCIEALIPQLAAAGVRLPQYFVLMTPYAVTLAVMIWVAMAKSGSGDEPGALGEPFVREERR